MKIVILGVSGMLGSMVLNYLANDNSLQITATARDTKLIRKQDTRWADVNWELFDAEKCSIADIIKVIDGSAWVINAIGVIKPYIHDDNAAEVERATRVNALFPHLLAKAAAQSGAKVIQIATDCVYSGLKGQYNEADSHDALDVYGKTKSIGEVCSPSVYHLRCSIIGPEPKGSVSLMDWFLNQQSNAGVNGYSNHHWNGITTLHYAKVCHGIIKDNITLPHMQHIIPRGNITKADLLNCIARDYKRKDITISPTMAKNVINRTLSTTNDSLNRQIWAAAGYCTPPSVSEMVTEMADFDYRF